MRILDAVNNDKLAVIVDKDKLTPSNKLARFKTDEELILPPKLAYTNDLYQSFSLAFNGRSDLTSADVIGVRPIQYDGKTMTAIVDFWILEGSAFVIYDTNMFPGSTLYLCKLAVELANRYFTQQGLARALPLIEQFHNGVW